MRNIVFSFMLAAVVTVGYAAPFTPGNLVVTRVGDGSAALSSAATRTFLDEYTTGGVLVQSIPMPTVVNGNNKRLTNSGTATSEGYIALSVDWRFLTLAGYNAGPGDPNVATTPSATTNRVVGRVDYAGNIDTTTALSDAYSAGNPRSAVSTNGVDIWTGGTGSSGPGVRYMTLGSTTSTQLEPNAPTNIRVVNIYSGQLYCSSATSTWQGVSTVGLGLPMVPPQTITLLPGFPIATGPSPYNFWFADSSTLYVADDRAVASGGGIQKWTYAGGIWSLAYTLNVGAYGARGVIGTTNGLGQTVLYVIAAGSTAGGVTTLKTVTDTGTGVIATLLATSATYTAFRDVTFTPTLPQPTGACCVGSTCVPNRTASQCLAQGGIWKGAGTDCFPNPCVPIDYYWDFTTGELGGNGYNGQWIYYPNAPGGAWYNMWWPNEFALNREKEFTITFTTGFPTGSGYLEAAMVWATPDWMMTDRPPLADEEQFIQRQFLGTITTPGTYTFTGRIPFCPSWVSIDVRGGDYVVEGTIRHICLLPTTGACCVGWDCSIQTPQACTALCGRYQGDGTTCVPNPCPITDTVVCEPQPPIHPPTYWYDVTPGNFGRCDFHVRVYDPDPANYTNIVMPANWVFLVHTLLNGEVWASWWDPTTVCENAIFGPTLFGFTNSGPSAWGDWATTIGNSNDPYWCRIDSSVNHPDLPDGLGYRVHVPLPAPTGACCIGPICSMRTEVDCIVAGGVWLGPSVDCFPNPCVPIHYYWDSLTGEMGGTGWNHEWIEYPFSPTGTWWNMWWPNEFNTTRQKRIMVTFDVEFPAGTGVIEIALNWSTPDWQLSTRPPLAMEEQYIERAYLGSFNTSGTYTYTFMVPYCPAWVSMDVRGNAYVIQGTIDHICLPAVLGACCFFNGACQELTEADCLASGGVRWMPGVPCFPNPCICLGDSNCDGVISWRDIDFFVAAMSGQTAWQAMFPTPPPCPYTNNDVNGDGAVNWRDIDPFVALMGATCPW